MDVARARMKWRALQRMTVECGCSPHEAATAVRLADVLAKKYGLTDDVARAPWRKDFDARFSGAQAKAAHRYGWEFRTCGKARCHCMRGGAPHGPYKYRKERRGETVNSIYRGR